MAAKIPPTMKAWTFSQAGSHRQVLSKAMISTPKPPTNDQVMIKVAYCGLNFGDIKLMRMVPSILRRKDSIPGCDYSGTVLDAGPLAPSNFAVGTRVFGVLATASLFEGQGALCDYICLSTKQHLIMPVPKDCTLEDAGCLSIGGTMAYLICKNGGIKENCGLRILVNGASGGCGTIFVQVARAMGAKQIIATCSAPSFELVKSLGADKAIDYRDKKPLHGYLAKEFGDRKFDFVLDTVGAQKLYENSPGYLKEDGVYVNIGDFTNGMWLTAFHWFLNYFRPVWLGGTPRRFIMFGPSVDGEAGDWLTKLIAEGNVRAVIDRSVSFDEVLEVSLVLAI
jgi:NADPH:quinone reductase-like Zn-dependent oxidoreductase